MSDTCSTYEAKARFSGLLRMVRSGRSVTITYHGEAVAELRPIRAADSVEARIDQLSERGLVTARPDAWHVATALFLVPTSSELPFLTLDQRQRAIAQTLGFPTP